MGISRKRKGAILSLFVFAVFIVANVISIVWPIYYDDLMDKHVKEYPYVVYEGHGIMFVEPDTMRYLGYLNVNYTAQSWNRTINVTVENWQDFPCIVGYVPEDTYGKDIREPVYISFAWYVPIIENGTFNKIIGFECVWKPRFEYYSAYVHTWDEFTLTVDFWMPV